MQGAVTVVSMVAPAVVSLLVLGRLLAARHTATLVLQDARSLAQHQTALLDSHLPPSVALSVLLVRSSCSVLC